MDGNFRLTEHDAQGVTRKGMSSGDDHGRACGRFGKPSRALSVTLDERLPGRRRALPIWKCSSAAPASASGLALRQILLRPLRENRPRRNFLPQRGLQCFPSTRAARGAMRSIRAGRAAGMLRRGELSRRGCSGTLTSPARDHASMRRRESCRLAACHAADDRSQRQRMRRCASIPPHDGDHIVAETARTEDRDRGGTTTGVA